MTLPLDHTMEDHEDFTISVRDYLGTAHVNADAASRYLARLRDGSGGIAGLEVAANHLAVALQDVEAVLRVVKT